jgi:hypothetical protein
VGSRADRFLSLQRNLGLAISPLVQDSQAVKLFALILLIMYIPVCSMVVGVLDGLDEELDRLVASGGRTVLSRAYLAGRESYAGLRNKIRKPIQGVAR